MQDLTPQDLATQDLAPQMSHLTVSRKIPQLKISHQDLACLYFMSDTLHRKISHALTSRWCRKLTLPRTFPQQILTSEKHVPSRAVLTNDYDVALIVPSCIELMRYSAAAALPLADPGMWQNSGAPWPGIIHSEQFHN